jgi:HK97 family phage portal protein
VGLFHGRKADLIAGGGGSIVVDPFGPIGRPNLEGMLFPEATYQNYALNGFGRNELVYACILKKARTLPQARLRVYGEQQVEPLEDHRLRRLIAQPNEATNEVEFLMLSVVHLDLSGNCYWLIVRARDGLPAELWPIRPDLIRVLPNPVNPRQWAYGYALDPEAQVRFGPTEIIPVSRRDVIHLKYPNPLDAYFGQAPLRPATRAVSVDNARTDFVDALLRNDAVPRVVVTTQQKIDQKIVDRLEERWSRKYGGVNRGKPAFLQFGMDVKPLALNLTDLEFGDMSGITEARICSALGVQPILVGAKVGLDRSTFANFHEAKVELWEDTLMNLQDMIEAGVATQLLPEFLGVGRARVSVRWDTSAVLALQEAERERWERATNALARGGITRNQFLRIVGLDEVSGGDVFLTPAGVLPTPVGEATPPPAELTEGSDETGPRSETLEAASYAHRYLARVNGNGNER